VRALSTRNVALTERQDELIDARVETGRSHNAREVLREGLRLSEQRDAEDAPKLSALRKAARIGWAAFDAGRFTTASDANEIRNHLRARAAKIIAATSHIARATPISSWTKAGS
jgi:antitoxin ParD1/3/4